MHERLLVPFLPARGLQNLPNSIFIRVLVAAAAQRLTSSPCFDNLGACRAVLGDEVQRRGFLDLDDVLARLILPLRKRRKMFFLPNNFG